jgi:hypothetical protein
MTKDTIIVSMTTWPPRIDSAVTAMRNLVTQGANLNVHFVLVLSRDEFQQVPESLRSLGVEIIMDSGNLRSHKKLMPTLVRYPDNPVLVVDDDVLREDGWLETFVSDQTEHPDEIIYGYALSRVYFDGEKIVEDCGQTRRIFSRPGCVSTILKPANGSGGTLYPAHTFTDPRFFERDLMMQLSPTSDETWQFAFAKIEKRTFRCLSAHNYPIALNANQDCALYRTNKDIYTVIHNRIAAAIPEYIESLI